MSGTLYDVRCRADIDVSDIIDELDTEDLVAELKKRMVNTDQHVKDKNKLVIDVSNMMDRLKWECVQNHIDNFKLEELEQFFERK